jgi:uncharacterized protein (DUF2344 family)
MPDYQNGKIYKLYSPSKNLVYYGSTVQTLSQRLGGHIRENRRGKHCSSSEIIECGDYKIELLEDYPCNNKQQLERKEGEYIKNNECINKCVAGRGNKEYYIDNADKLKEYYENNKEEIKQKSLKYYNDNRDKIREYKKQYYLKQKELKDKL